MALRGALDETTRVAVMKVSQVFRRLCAQEIRIDNRDSELTDTVEALCLMEKAFPPTFIDVMSHLLIHLVEELYICGPVYCRWMYPIERYIKSLKAYVRIYARPEASMAEGYTVTETRMNDEILQGGGWARPLS